jgi:hypothetical protein
MRATPYCWIWSTQNLRDWHPEQTKKSNSVAQGTDKFTLEDYSNFDRNGDASYRLILRGGQALEVAVNDTVHSDECFSFDMKAIRRVVIDSRTTSGDPKSGSANALSTGGIAVKNKALAPSIHQRLFDRNQG